MIKIAEIQFNAEMILSDGKFVLVEMFPHYEEATTKAERIRTGTEVIVALTSHRLEKITVIVNDNIACGPLNELELAQVYFEDFKGNFTYNEELEDYLFAATASKLVIVQ